MIVMEICFYKPPPLDEVWLSEPERRERREALDKQRQRREAHERQLASDASKRTPTSHDDVPPGLVVSDDEDSDDESTVGDPSPECDSGSEGENIWHADHPSMEIDPAQPDSVT